MRIGGEGGNFPEYFLVRFYFFTKWLLLSAEELSYGTKRMKATMLLLLFRQQTAAVLWYCSGSTSNGSTQQEVLRGMRYVHLSVHSVAGGKLLGKSEVDR